jgi:pimeloyl-ACP methyl ester carboxylesterase
VLPTAARHPAQLYVAGSLALLGFGGLGVSYAAIAALVAQRSGLVLAGPFVRNGKTGVMRRRPGHVRAFPATTHASHDLAEAPLADVTAPALVVMGEQDRGFPDLRAEAGWIGRALRAHVVMVPEAGHYPRSQRSGVTVGAVLRFLESVTGRA